MNEHEGQRLIMWAKLMLKIPDSEREKLWLGPDPENPDRRYVRLPGGDRLYYPWELVFMMVQRDRDASEDRARKLGEKIDSFR